MSSQNNQKLYKFIFTAHIKTITLALKFPCVVSVIWKRGQKAHQVKQRKPIEKGIIIFNQQLQLQCNMTFDTNKKVFQQKKTKFTVLIFSQKGNKQAGQVHLDVAQLLNSKSKQLQLQKNLQKCPDKNAKLTFTLSGYMKQQITPDLVSKRSQKTYDIQASLISTPSVQPDFKKKKIDTSVASDISNNSKGLNQSNNSNSVSISLESDKKVNSGKNNNIPIIIPGQKSTKNVSNNNNISKQNTVNSSRQKLQQQNKKLKQQIKQLRDLQLQNQNLRRKYEQADKKAQSYYKKKYMQIKQEQTELLEKSKQIKQLIKKKQQLQNVYCQCKQNIGKIFNYVIMTGNDQLMDFLQSQDL